MSWHAVARVDEIEEGGEPAMVEIGKKRIGVFRRGGAFFAVLDFCPHAGAPICRGQVTGRVTLGETKVGYDPDALTLRCPWHRWEFDLKTGVAVADIRQKVKVFPTRIADGVVEVEL
jgi:nitrite reductase/ring-hydroxylating ferredoxin subunit